METHLDYTIRKIQKIHKVRKKVIFLMAVPLRGGGGKGLAIKKKITFRGLFYMFQNVRPPLSSRGGGLIT